MPQPQPTPPHRVFYPIQSTRCSRCGRNYVYCRLEMLNPFIKKSTIGLCPACIYGKSATAVGTKKITSLMGYEVALKIGGASG